MDSRYEYLERIPRAVFGGFQLKTGQSATIQCLYFNAARNGQDGPLNTWSSIYPPIPAQGTVRLIEHVGLSPCSLSDLTDAEFKNLCDHYPRDELEELRNLEREYEGRVRASAQIKLDQELRYRSQR